MQTNCFTKFEDSYFGDWLKVIDCNLLQKYKNMLMQAITNGISFEPQAEHVFKAFRMCPYNECCAVILSQDPYPQKGVATGIAFGNDLTKHPYLSPSLGVILNCIARYSEDLPNFDTTLETWEKQGILMLNSSLTVRTNQPGSHAEAWKPFTKSLVERLSEEKPNLFWLLLGKQAWEFKDYIKDGSAEKNGNIVMEYHPAYYARNNTPMPQDAWKRMLDYVYIHFRKNLILYE